jgi:hypothetical protein
VTIGKERRIISIIFVGGHVLACALVGIFLLVEWIDSTDATLFVSIAVPALTPYTTIVFKDYLRRRKLPELRAADSRVEESPTLMILPPFCLLTVLLSVIIARVFLNRLSTVESFATALLLGEGLFGLYTGMVVHTLFGNDA